MNLDQYSQREKPNLKLNDQNKIQNGICSLENTEKESLIYRNNAECNSGKK